MDDVCVFVCERERDQIQLAFVLSRIHDSWKKIFVYLDVSAYLG